MDIHDRKARRVRAMRLFEAEAREQQLAGVALRQTAGNGAPAASGPPLPDAGHLLPALQPIDDDAQADLLEAHQDLRAARRRTASLTAADADLARLNAQIDGIEPAHAQLDTDAVIEGEATVVDASAPMLPPPNG